MTKKEKIEEYIEQSLLDEAIAAASENIAAQPQDALWPFLRGKAYWRKGEQRKAINDYELAASLDPASPAHAALEMSRGIFDFFNPDLLNP